MAEEISKKEVVYRIDGVDAITVRPEANIDIYAGPATDARSAAIIVAGYPDAGFHRFFGASFKDMGFVTSWARLIAASGVTAVAYSNREPVSDLVEVIRKLRGRGVDDITLFATSGHGPLAVSMLMHDAPARIDRVALLYAYTLGVPADAKKYGFATPADDRKVREIDPRIPVFIARAGQDAMPELNATLDRFVSEALAANVPLTLLNHPTAPHAFDLGDASAMTASIIRAALAFISKQSS